MSTPEAIKALSKAKVALMCEPNSVFFSHLCLSLVHQWVESIPTAATNGKRIIYNPTFFMSLSELERVGVMLHEVLHVAFRHMERLDERDAKKWNVAADYVINLIVIAAGFLLPSGCLYDRQYEGMTTEEVYDLLPDGTSTSPDWEDLMEPDPDSDLAADQAEIDSILVQAEMHSKAQNDRAGTVPMELQRYIDSLLNPVVPWDRVLASYMTKMAKTERTFRRPNRRYSPKMILPTRYSRQLGNITVAIDTSGSIGQKEFDVFVSEAAGIIRSAKPKETQVIQFGTNIVGEAQTLKTLSDIETLEFFGGGGTAIDPVMEWAVENKPELLIIFTDGYYSEPRINPKLPILWMVYNNPGFTTPFGKHIPYPLKGQ